MDIFAHALWSGAIYNKKRVWWAIFFGIAPDLFSFGVFSAANISTMAIQLITFDPDSLPHLSHIPSYVYSLYNVSHSLVVWAVLFSIAWLYFKRVPWELTAWALHIIIDIPTHSAAFFPTPFLWPLPQPLIINGVSWVTPWFIILNYASVAIVYGLIHMRNSR